VVPTALLHSKNVEPFGDCFFEAVYVAAWGRKLEDKINECLKLRITSMNPTTFIKGLRKYLSTSRTYEENLKTMYDLIINSEPTLLLTYLERYIHRTLLALLNLNLSRDVKGLYYLRSISNNEVIATYTWHGNDTIVITTFNMGAFKKALPEVYTFIDRVKTQIVLAYDKSKGTNNETNQLVMWATEMEVGAITNALLVKCNIVLNVERIDLNTRYPLLTRNGDPMLYVWKEIVGIYDTDPQNSTKKIYLGTQELEHYNAYVPLIKTIEPPPVLDAKSSTSGPGSVSAAGVGDLTSRAALIGYMSPGECKLATDVGGAVLAAALGECTIQGGKRTRKYKRSKRKNTYKYRGVLK
jgi:hypothetical protein